jgi:malate dehydrogenase (oxaloacetate-decarboxylating)(NADP+)
MPLSQVLDITEQEILNYHLGGKVCMEALREIIDRKSLSIAYTPGVAKPCLLIRDDPETVNKYTSRGNLVAVVTDGTAVLGLGDIGPRASIPVMEGKAALFKIFAKIDAWPVPLEHCRIGGDKGPTDTEKFVEVAASIAGMYGGINLEDIAAPACFEVEEQLQERVDCPVFHDDQWGTAVITLAALRNYSLLTGKSIPSLSVVINGAGAAGIKIAETIQLEGVKNLILLDSRGVIHSEREDLNPYKKPFAIKTNQRNLSDALRGADVFIGVSKPGSVTKEMALSMAEYPAIFAMANPDPEIKPGEVQEAMGDRPYIMATGRSDYPNQINNALGFPYLFRGALDVRAKRITISMKQAAAEALARVVQKKAPEYLQQIYPGENLSFGPRYIIPKPFDKRLLVEVSYAVAKAAFEEGASAINDLSHYRSYLEAIAYTPYDNAAAPFIIEEFCSFGDYHTLCIGKDLEGHTKSYLCDPLCLDGVTHHQVPPGQLVTLSLRKGKVVKISP